MLVWFLPLFLIFLLIGMPVFFAMLASPGILLWLTDSTRDWNLLYRNVYNGMDSFPLMAIKQRDVLFLPGHPKQDPGGGQKTEKHR